MNTLFEAGLNLPVEKLTTSLTRNDLIVKEKTLAGIEAMENWLRPGINHSNINNTISGAYPGFRTIFTGPSGTGKTLAAALLGKETGHDVFRIDLSNVVSMYIGETEKNLDKLFLRAMASDVILFFDEADALFGKRTEVRDSHDRYANLDISWLLQRIDSFTGMLILAFNKPLNMDSPFFKRFNLIIEFEKPDRVQRLKLWRKYLPLEAQLEMKFDVDEIARDYKLTGGEIVNAIHTAGEKNLNTMTMVFLLQGIQNKMK